jgi:4-oxalocrotonate tautomerase
MPLVRAYLPTQLTVTQVQHLSNAIHEALVTTFNVPEADRFQVLTQLTPQALICSTEYLGIKHSDKVAFIQITCNEGRTVDMKKALYAHIANGIAQGLVIKAADVIISLVEVKKENWSFGDGIAQYAM